MAYTVPTAADLITRYPAFASVASATIDLHIADAAAGVDETWTETNYGPGLAALAAHRMALLGIGDHGEAAGYAAAGVTSVRSGNFQASFSESTVAKRAAGGLNATPYGRIYKTLLTAEKGGPRVVGAGVYPDGWYPLEMQNNGIILP